MSASSIQRSLSRWFAIQTLVGLSIACTGIYGVTRWSFQLKQSEEFERHSELVRHVVDETRAPPNLNALRHKLDDYFQTHPDIAVSLWVGSEQVYQSHRVVPQGHWISQSLVPDSLSFDDKPVRLELTLDSSSDDLLLRRLAWTLIAAAALGSLVVAYTGFLVVRHGLKPLKMLAAQTAAAGPNKPGTRIDSASYSTEIQPWIEQFNALLERVESAYAQLEAFNADVAHELRTPLANMIAQVEIELSQVRAVSTLRDALASQLEEARRLSAIVTDMLFLSKADRGAQARRAGPVSMAEQVAAVGEFHEAELEQSELSLRVDGDAELQVDTGLLRRAVSNLLSNAIRYAEPRSLICAVIQRDGQMVSVTVVNRGDPIHAAALPHLFERFYRADRSRSGSASHHGLGLTIVAAIARMHGGETFAESGGGVTRIGFSLADADPPQNA
ncbi:MAG: heavy metal sensor histidine kinase [Gammaproteobacteria bacterium]|nr:heavy metal sensor histidine kinase [Gammaproteobacteria bacterium]MBU1443293.1 heavy metal sensor histidine kinase [Gammaproteobacteria bacterium]MBU2285088.1 heavy metal sensor histidine kinase [Gammaproteobacteria bacterium]MBU2410939.1 heavy metal sensor histidine kinase [Gammaproteobacteria bacterium]